jgi:hypothetical protein
MLVNIQINSLKTAIAQNGPSKRFVAVARVLQIV